MGYLSMYLGCQYQKAVSDFAGGPGQFLTQFWTRVLENYTSGRAASLPIVSTTDQASSST
jgi:hypothetical protein